jgi:hypothetical protein
VEETATNTPTPTSTSTPTETSTPFPTLPLEGPSEPTVTPTPFPTLPLEGPSEPTVTPTPFPTLPQEGPSEPTVTPVLPTAFLSLPAFASMDDGAPDWQRSAGWQLTSEAAYGGLGFGWQVSATNTVELLRWSLPLDLRTVVPGQTVQMRYQSLLQSVNSIANVQVSLDATNWVTVGTAGAWGQWTVETVDLSTFTGQLIYVQFEWQGLAPSSDDLPADIWYVDEVAVGVIAPTPTPTTELVLPTATAVVLPTEGATNTLAPPTIPVAVTTEVPPETTAQP